MRIAHLASFLALATLAACGGGGGGGGSSGGLLKGNVVAVNGSSSSVGGVTVKALATGAMALTNTAGGFTLPSVPAGTQTISFKTSGGSEQEIEVEIEDGGEVRVSLSVNDDSIEDLDEDHCDDGASRTEARAELVSAMGSKGYVRVRRDADGDQGFDVEAEGLTPGLVVAMVVINPDTTAETTIGTATASALEGEAEVELRTGDGDQLPFNVGSVAVLEDFIVEVRNNSTGAVLASGRVPAIGALPECTGDDDNDGNDDGDDNNDGVDDDSEESEGRSMLASANGATGYAKTDIEARSSGSDWKLKVEVENTSVVGPLTVYVDLGSGYVLFGTMQAEGAGEFEYELEDNDTLPAGLTSVSQLWQRPVQVRNSNGTTAYFTGTLPLQRSTW
ncbi:MAG: carboxypeptidase-like regulatory domain-containing protein [Planctomycetia bacterium]